jgi:hypothetical protein
MSFIFVNIKNIIEEYIYTEICNFVCLNVLQRCKNNDTQLVLHFTFITSLLQFTSHYGFITIMYHNLLQSL